VRAAREARTRTAGHEGHSRVSTRANDGGDFLGRGRQHDEIRTTGIQGQTVALIDEELIVANE
jgi:hypothetical protein